MAEENEATQDEAAEAPPKKGNKKLIIIIAAVLIVVLAGGFVGYTLLAGKGGETEESEDGHGKAKKENHADDSTIIALTPFILNLTDQGRYLKISMTFEISGDASKEMVEKKTPQLRDTIITLVGSKSIKSISTAEGKFQLKDELLFRANQILGMENDIFKNLYFTEFVMQ